MTLALAPDKPTVVSRISALTDEDAFNAPRITGISRDNAVGVSHWRTLDRPVDRSDRPGLLLKPDSLGRRCCEEWPDAIEKLRHCLSDVRCHCDETTLYLSGHVRRYTHLQKAITIARQLAGTRRIDLAVAVIASPLS